MNRVDVKWKEVSGVMCDRRKQFELMDKASTLIMTSNGIKLLILCQKECMGMLRWTRGKAMLDHRNDNIVRDMHTKHVGTLNKKQTTEDRSIWET